MEVAKGGPHKGGGGEQRIEVSCLCGRQLFQAACWEPGKKAPRTVFDGPRPTGWKTRGTILKVLPTVLTGGHEDITPPLHKNALPFMAILFLKHFES